MPLLQPLLLPFPKLLRWLWVSTLSANWPLRPCTSAHVPILSPAVSHLKHSSSFYSSRASSHLLLLYGRQILSFSLKMTLLPPYFCSSWIVPLLFLPFKSHLSFIGRLTSQGVHEPFLHYFIPQTDLQSRTNC